MNLQIDYEGVPFVKRGGDVFLSVNDLITWLRQHHTVNDRAVKKSNIDRELAKRTSVFAEGSSERVVSFAHFIEFAFSHQEHFAVCNRVVARVCEALTCEKQFELSTPCRPTKKLCQEKSTQTSECTQRSCLHLYQQIAKTLIFAESETYILSKIPGKNLRYEYLVQEHRHNFTFEEWQRICIFEHHYASFYHASACEYAFILNRKYDFFNLCQDSMRVGGKFGIMAEKVLKNNAERKQAGDILDKIHLDFDGIEPSARCFRQGNQGGAK